jgi:hypothetical protein
LSGQKGKDAMTRSDWKVGGDRAGMKYRHPLVAKLTNLLHALASCTDPSKRKVRWTPQAEDAASVSPLPLGPPKG